MYTRIHLSALLQLGFASTFVAFNWLSEINAVSLGALLISAMICASLALPIFLHHEKSGFQQGADNLALIALATNLLLQTPWMSGWGNFHLSFAIAFTTIAWISHSVGALAARPVGDWHSTLRRQQRWSHS